MPSLSSLPQQVCHSNLHIFRALKIHYWLMKRINLWLQYKDGTIICIRVEDWCWQGLGAGGEGDDRGWDGWMASPTQWTWIWVNSRSWWWTGRPGVLWFMGSQSRTRLSDWTERTRERERLQREKEEEKSEVKKGRKNKQSPISHSKLSFLFRNNITNLTLI